MTAALTTPPLTTDCDIPTLARLEVVARTAPELIERVCRLLRHRGATVEHLVVTAHGDGLTTLGLTVRIDGDQDLLPAPTGSTHRRPQHPSRLGRGDDVTPRSPTTTARSPS